MNNISADKSLSHREILDNTVSFRKNLIDVSSISSSKLRNILDSPTSSRRGLQRRWSDPYCEHFDSVQNDIRISDSSRSLDQSISIEDDSFFVALLKNDPNFREVDGFFELVDSSDTQKRRGFLINHLETCKSIMRRKFDMNFEDR